MHVEKDISLASHTTLKVGGRADFFVVVRTLEELKEAVLYAHEHQLSTTVLGGGSNVLVSDSGVRGLVIKNEIEVMAYDDDRAVVVVGAGVMLDACIEALVARGWWGLENLSGIPGTVGATPIQNVGAYGVEVGECIVHVEVLDARTMEVRVLDAASCAFAYRHSFFKTDEGKHFIVTRVAFQCSTEPKPILGYKDVAERFTDNPTPSLRDIRGAIIDIRSRKFPDWHVVGTAGSFFKNPIVDASVYESLKTTFPLLPGFSLQDGRVKIPLGWILDSVCNLRGYRDGMVGTYEGQALVVVNHGTTRAEDIAHFAHMLQERVKEKTGIDVAWEVTKLS